MSNLRRKFPGENGSVPGGAIRDHRSDQELRSDHPSTPASQSNSDRSKNAQCDVRANENGIATVWEKQSAARKERAAKAQSKRNSGSKKAQQGRQSSKSTKANPWGKNVLNDKLGTAHNASAHHTEKDQKSTEKTNGVVANEEERDDETFSLKDIKKAEKSQFYEDLELLYAEGKKGMDKKVYSDKARNRRNQFEKIKGTAPLDILVTLLNEITYNPKSLQYKMVNDSNLFPRVMQSIFLERLPSLMKTTSENAAKLHVNFQQLMVNHQSVLRTMGPIPNDDEKSVIESLGNEIQSVWDNYFDAGLSLTAFKCMERIRIIKGRAHFPQALDITKITHIFRSTGLRGLHCITPEDIRKKMNEFLLQTKFSSDNAPNEFFGFTREAIGVCNFLYAKASYLPFENDEKAQQYYSRFFLDPADKIINFMPRASRSIDGKIETDVLVELGSNRLPPAKKTAGKVHEDYKRQTQNDNYAIGMIEMLTEELIDLGVAEDPEDKPEVKKWRAQVKTVLSDLQMRQKRVEKMVLSLGDKPAHTVVEDEYLMTSEILFR